MIDFKKQIDEIETNTNSLDTLEDTLEKEFSKEKRKKRKKIRTYIISITVIALIFAGQIIISSQSTATWLAEKGIFAKLKYLTPGAEKRLKGETNDRINIIILGIGGDNHEGAHLSDTNILLSLKPSSKEVAMFSLPRDLVVPISNIGWHKINYLNAYAENQKKGSGGDFVISTLSNILQIPIDYYLRVDFTGFIDVINELGDVELYVENEINDYFYPIYGQENNPDYYARFEYLNIKKGWQKMNSSLALKYVRSRRGLGIEGSDFARAKRQQNLLIAIKNKLLSRQTLLNPVTMGKLANKFSKNIQTNLEVWEIIKLWNLFKEVEIEQISNIVFSDAPGGMLYPSISEQGAYILQPISGNFGQIRNFIQNIFDDDNFQEEEQLTIYNQNSATKPAIPTEKLINTFITDTDKALKPDSDYKDDVIVKDENIFLANIVVKNGTPIVGLAKTQSNKLADLNFNVIEVSNAPTNNYLESFVYDLNYGQKTEALTVLKNNYNLKQIYSFPNWLKIYEDNELIDFLIILGEDWEK